MCCKGECVQGCEHVTVCGTVWILVARKRRAITPHPMVGYIYQERNWSPLSFSQKTLACV